MYSTYIEWQWPLSGVHSIMMIKSAQSGEGAGCTPFSLSTITSKVVVLRFSWVDRYTPPIYHLPLYLLCELANPSYFIVAYESSCGLNRLCPQRLMASVLAWSGVLLSLAGAEGVEGLICYCNRNFSTAWPRRGCLAASFWKFQLLVYM